MFGRLGQSNAGFGQVCADSVARSMFQHEHRSTSQLWPNSGPTSSVPGHCQSFLGQLGSISANVGPYLADFGTKSVDVRPLLVDFGAT